MRKPPSNPRPEVDFNSLDLNLLRTFDQIMRDGNLTQAGKKLDRTPPAMSQMLSRLREILGDPLFKSSGRNMVPTEYAKEIAPTIRDSLEQLRIALTAERTFDPATSCKTFLIGYAALHAPNVSFRISSDRAGELLNELRTGETELSIDHDQLDGPDMRSTPLYTDPFVVISRKGHPAIEREGGLTLETFVAAEHVAVSWTRGRGDSPMDVKLAEVGIKRNCKARVPTLSALPAVVEETDLLASMSMRVAKRIQKHWDVDIHPAPYRISPVVLYLIWHRRFDTDPAHNWLREAFKAAVDHI